MPTILSSSRVKRIMILVIVSLLLTFCSVQAQTGAPGSPGTVKWTSGRISGNNFDAPPAIGGRYGRIYVGKQDGKLYAFTPEGALKWTFKIGEGMSGISTAPAIGEDGTIYFGSGDGYLYAITDNDTRATLKWQYPAAGAEALGSIASSPAITTVANGTVYFGCNDHYLYAVSAPSSGSTGMLKWKYEVQSSVYSSPAIGADGTIYVGSSYGYILALTDSGQKVTLKWSYPAEGSDPIESVASSPAIGGDGTIYVNAGNLTTTVLYAIKPDGNMKWKLTTLQGGSAGWSSPVIGADGTIYVGTDANGDLEGRLYAVTDNGTVGAIKWSYRIRPESAYAPYGTTDTPAIDTNGVIYFGASDGYLYALTDNRTEGALKWRSPDCNTNLSPEGSLIYSSPLIGPDGTIYIGAASEDAFLAFYGDSRGLSTDSPWPAFHYNAARTGQSLADVNITAVSDPPATAAPGSTFQVTTTVKNYGGSGVRIGPANCPSNVGYYLTNSERTFPMEKATAPVVAIRSSNTISANLTVPANVVQGAYSLLACADDLQVFAEVDKNNNCAAAGGHVTVGSTPLGMNSVIVNSLAGSAGTAITLGTGDAKAGYASVNLKSGSAPYATAVFGMKQNGVTVTEAGVPASPPTTKARIFIDYRSAVPAVPGRPDGGPITINTGIAVVNSDSQTANVTYVLRDTQGVQIGTQGHGTIAAGAHFARFIDQMNLNIEDYTVAPDFPAVTQPLFATLEVSSDRALSIVALRMTTNQRGDILFTTTPIADLTRQLATGPTYFPQFADGGGYTTTLILLNTSDKTETGAFTILDNNGAALKVKQVGGSFDSSFPYSVPAGGVYRFQTDGLPANATAGWVQLTPATGTSTPVGAGVFSYNPGTVLLTESGIPSAASSTHARVFVDLSGGHNTGLALANLTTSNATVTVAAYQSDGSTAAGTSKGPISLKPSGHDAMFADQLISGLPSGFVGVLDISSETPIAALALRSLTNERGDFLLATFPVADLNQPAPSPIVFPQIADGGGYVTQFVLLSAGSSSKANLNFFGDDGKPIAVGK